MASSIFGYAPGIGSSTSRSSPFNITGSLTPTIVASPKAPQYIYKNKKTGEIKEYLGYGDESFYTKIPNPNYNSGSSSSSLSSSSSGSGSGTASTTSQNNGDALTKQYQQAYDQAKAANEARYAQINSGYDTLAASTSAALQDRLNTAMAMLENAGTQEAADISAGWKNKQGEGVQGLVDSGMYNSTIMPTMKMGYQAQESSDLGRLKERLLSNRLSTYGQMSGDIANANQNNANNKLNFMANRNDTYPDMGSYAQLMQQYGQTASGGTGTDGSGSGTSGTGTGVVTAPQSIKVDMNPKTRIPFGGNPGEIGRDKNGQPIIIGLKPLPNKPQPWSVGGPYDTKPSATTTPYRVVPTVTIGQQGYGYNPPKNKVKK